MMTIDMSILGQILTCILITVLLLLVGHWFRWDLWLGKELPRIPAYIYGILSILMPVSVVLILWQYWLVLLLIWGCVIAGGIAVMIAYYADEHSILRKKDQIAKEERRILHGQTDQVIQ